MCSRPWPTAAPPDASTCPSTSPKEVTHVCRVPLCGCACFVACLTAHAARTCYPCMCRVSYCRQIPRWLLRLLEKHLLNRGIKDERRVGLSCCANDKHRQLRGREERAEPKGARVHADVVRKDPLGHMLAHVPPCLLNSAWLPSLDPHFFRGSPVHHPPGRQYARGTYRRRQSSSSLRTRRGQRERDGARAPWRAPRAIWSISIASEPMLELSR